MTRPADGTSPAWDATAPASGWDAPATGRDALAVTGGDALSATYTAPSTDALAVGYARDALGVGYARDPLASGDVPAAADPLAVPVLGDTFADSLTAYGDATATERPGARRRAPRPGPVRPGTVDDRSPAEVAGRADPSQRGGGTARRTPRPRPGASGAAAGRAGRPAAGSGAATGRSGRPAAGSGAGRTRSPGSGTAGPGSAGAGARSGQPGAGGSASGAGRPGAGGSAASGRSGLTWEELNRIGPRTAGSGDRYGGRPRDVPAPRSQGSSSPWANRPTRPSGTVPWVGGSGRSGWDDFFAGMGGTSGGSGTQPSGAEVARAMLDALRRARRSR